MKKRTAISRAAVDWYRSIFEHSSVSLWEEDISGLRELIKQWTSRRIPDLRAYLRAHPALVRKGVRAVRVVDVNEATLRLYEAGSRADLLGPLDTTLDPGAMGDFIDLFAAMAEGRERFEAETSARTLTGKRLELLVRTFIPSETDAYPYMLVNVVDFTDYKRLESRLREERSVVRAVIDSVPDQIFIKDREGRFVLANRQLATWAGMSSPEQMIGKTDYDFFPKEVADLYSEYDRQILKSATGETDIEEEIISAAGVHAWALTTKLPFSDASGAATGILGIVRDITERKKLERRIDEERSLLRTVVNTLPDGIFLKDTRGRFILVNKPVADIMQATKPEDLIGRTDRDFYPAEMAAEFAADERLIIGQGRRLINKEEPKLVGGTTHWILTTKVPIFDADGIVAGVVGITKDISALKKAQEAQRQSEERYRTIFMEAPIGIFQSTLEGKLISVNPAFARMVGYDFPVQLIDAVNRKNVAEVLYEDPGQRPAIIDAVLKDRQWRRVENRYRHRNGSTVIAQLMLRAYVPIGSSTPLLEGFVEDVTERVKAEAALARERAFLTALMDNVPDYIYFKDRESRFILNNKAHVRELGAKSPADVLGKTDFDFFAPQHAQKAYNDEQQIIRTGQPLVNAVEQEIWTDRPLTWVSSTKMPLLDDKGEIVGTFGISRDMTERRQMEEKNLRLAAMVESSNDAIIGIDLDDIVTSWNKGAEKIFGYAAEEIIGRSINPLLSLDIVNQEPALREKLRSEGHVVGLESTVTRKDRKTVNVSTSISFVTDAGGQIVGITCIARDVTSQRALQAQIIRAQRLESLGTLAAGIAHQFNNINAAVKGYLEFLSRDAGLPAGARTYIGEALKAVQRAVDITDRLQALTSASQTSQETLLLEEAVPAILGLFEEQLENEGISLTTAFPPTPRVRVNQPMLAFIVTSLITNAIQALIARPSPCITVCTRSEAEFCCLEVSDTGLGISPENLPRVFTPFFTTKGEWAEPGSSQVKTKGVGLSLAVCQSTVAEIGGWIEVESAPENGATFRVWLPAASTEREP